MRKFASVSVLALSLVLGSSANAQIKAPASLKMKVGIGIGYQLCRDSKATPDLRDAFLCPGLLGTPKTVELELVNKPAAKPTWLFYEAPYEEEAQFNNIVVKVSAYVMYAKIDGVTMGYVDGKIISTENGKSTAPVYFRASAQGGLDKLSYSSAYGLTMPVPLKDKSVAQFSPYVVIQGAP